MIYRIDKIVRDVRVCIDQNMHNESLVSEDDIDTLSLDEIVRSKIVDAVRKVYLAAPLQMLEDGHHIEGGIYWREEQRAGSRSSRCGWLLLPDDFLRLQTFKMTDWSRAVVEPIDETDKRYALQSSRYAGVRGSAQKPVVAIVKRAEGLALEFYSCKSEDARVERALYITEPKIESGAIDISEKCYRDVVYEAAGLVVSALGDNAKMSTLQQESNPNGVTIGEQ